MIQTLNRHVKWREDKSSIFICDCKRLIDLKISFEYREFMKKLLLGVDKNKINKKEKKVFSDFEKMKLLSELRVEQLKEKDFQDAMDILDNELGMKRVRDSLYLFKKFKEFHQFFIGVYLDDEIIGIVCGFPREDYLLMSEIAVDSRFQKRRFGERLVKKFEEVAKKNKFNKINVGARDNAIGFYADMGYKPFLLIQFIKKDYDIKDFKDFKIIKFNNKFIEAEISNASLENIKKLSKDYPDANFQYIFTKKIKYSKRQK